MVSRFLKDSSYKYSISTNLGKIQHIPMTGKQINRHVPCMRLNTLAILDATATVWMLQHIPVMNSRYQNTSSTTIKF
uniref:Uncharacterized protein n=1 Tax=Arundo donax TaxID=35708 RepID=A0A0A9CX00_ARUDO